MELTYEQYTSPGYLNGFRISLKQVVAKLTSQLEAGEHVEMAPSAKAIIGLSNTALRLLDEIEAARDDADKLDTAAADAFARRATDEMPTPAENLGEGIPEEPARGTADAADLGGPVNIAEGIPEEVVEVGPANANEGVPANSAVVGPTPVQLRRDDATAGVLQVMALSGAVRELYMGYQYQTRPRQAQPGPHQAQGEFSPEDLSPDRTLH
jgi:hypothetical protein